MPHHSAAFLTLAIDPCNEVTVLQFGNLQLVPVIHGMDETVIKQGLHHENYSSVVLGIDPPVGSSVVCDTLDDFKTHIAERSFNKKVEEVIIQSIDGRVLLPICHSFRSRDLSAETVRESLETLISKTQSCLNCIRETEICELHQCQVCEGRKAICDECESQGHLHWSSSFRACKRCILNGGTCSRTMTCGCSMDSAAVQLKVMKEGLVEEKASKRKVPGFPDIVHVCKNVRNGIHNWCTGNGCIHCVEYVVSMEECLRVSGVVAEAREARRVQRHLAQQAELNEIPREQTTSRHGRRTSRIVMHRGKQ